MYTYYALTTLGIQVPKWFKQTLTTLQITQFVVGASYAFAHLFVAYQIPVNVPYLYHLGEAATSVTDDFLSAMSVARATATAGTGAWLKKAALRAAGQEGLAQNVLNEQGQAFGVDAVRAAQDFQARTETRYRNEIQWVHCLDTSGEVFAILLNCFYLAPLTWLFVKFFITAYTKRIERRQSSTAGEKAEQAGFSGKDALKGVTRQISEVANEGAVEEDHDEPKHRKKATKAQVNQRGGEGSRAAENEGGSDHAVADESAGDADEKKTPELQQGDSFVKVDDDPESPTEVRSISDEEENVEKHEAPHEQESDEVATEKKDTHGADTERDEDQSAESGVQQGQGEHETEPGAEQQPPGAFEPEDAMDDSKAEQDAENQPEDAKLNGHNTRDEEHEPSNKEPDEKVGEDAKPAQETTKSKVDKSDAAPEGQDEATTTSDEPADGQQKLDDESRDKESSTYADDRHKEIDTEMSAEKQDEAIEDTAIEPLAEPTDSTSTEEQQAKTNGEAHEE